MGDIRFLCFMYFDVIHLSGLRKTSQARELNFLVEHSKELNTPSRRCFICVKGMLCLIWKVSQKNSQKFKVYGTKNIRLIGHYIGNKLDFLNGKTSLFTLNLNKQN